MTGAIVGEDGLARPAWASVDPLLRDYYDTEWGMPVTDERGVFERVSLEAFQAGLSWITVLKKRERYRQVLHGFDPERLARLTDDEIAVLRERGAHVQRAAAPSSETRDQGAREAR